MLQKFSASYAQTNPNFVFLNLPEGWPEQSIVFSVASVIQNILTRSVCTHPSEYLKEKLGCVNADRQLFTVSKYPISWEKRIKGSSHSSKHNPASFFFHTLLTQSLGRDWAFIPTLMLPETPIAELPGVLEKDFVNQQVDFYLPQAKVVIEIDGSQHKDQQAYDYARDRGLKGHGITTLRFTTNDVMSKTAHFYENIQKLKNILAKNESLKNYYEQYNEIASLPDDYSIRRVYDIVMRLELLLLCLIKSGKLNLNARTWNIHLEGEDVWEYLSIAWQDLINWFSSLMALVGQRFNPPRLAYSAGTNPDAIINFSYIQRWNDEYERKPNVIYVRNDYFDDKDYYAVQIAPAISYSTNERLTDQQQSALRFLLKNLFGYDDFRSGQMEIIARTLARKTTVGILPTGAGKSICYQIAALLQPCVSFAVCPIISLITDQKRNLDELGMDRTGYISSDIAAAGKSHVLNLFSQKKLHIIWVSPERFQSTDFRLRLREIKDIGYAVIDEVHCLSEWGHDFRTSYLMLVKTITSNCPNAVLLGLTATASQMVRQDICREFNILADAVISPFKITRDELSFHVIRTNYRDRNQDLINVLNDISKKYGENIFIPSQENSKCGIIFALLRSPSEKKGLGTRYIVNMLKDKLKDPNCEICIYDSATEERQLIQDRFINNEFTLLVATKAFGMGVNKKNIRYTIHFGVPWSIEAFYQEAGRAGRDSRKDRNRSDCYILYDDFRRDEVLLETIFSSKTSVEDMVSLREGLGNTDINSILYLWQQNNDGVSKELDCMTRILKLLHKSCDGVITGNDYWNLILDEVTEPDRHKRSECKAKMEKALYRLNLLGMVGDWTFDSWNPERPIIRVYNVRIASTPEEFDDVFSKMIEYFYRYDRGFSLDGKDSKYDIYRNILSDPETQSKPIRRYMKCLLQWTYDNIVYSRKTAINNMLTLLKEYEENPDEKAFKDKVESFFTITDFSNIANELIKHPNDLSLWKAAVEYEDVDQAIATVSQYIESYRNNAGFDFALSMLQLMQGRYKVFGINERLRSAFRTASLLPEDSDEIVEFSLKKVRSAPLECREVLADALLEAYPEKAQYIQEKLHDRVSLGHLLNGTLIRLKNIERNL